MLIGFLRYKVYKVIFFGSVYFFLLLVMLIMFDVGILVNVIIYVVIRFFLYYF